MNKSGICYQAYIPMRKEPDETAEMVNQVLFGESFSVLEESRSGNFCRIQLHHDNYEGWINSGCISFPSEKDWNELKKLPVLVTHELNNVLTHANHEYNISLGCGSIIRKSSEGKTLIGKDEFVFPPNTLKETTKIRARLINYGLKVISVPYLWGGRSSFGFDCSGLCQNLYRQVGIEIPRDASMQSSIGHTLNFIGEALPGDLAFFDNEEGKIIHVGMILGENKILHASGKVKVDQIDHQGIFSKEKNKYTHELRLIKKIID